MHVSDRGVQLVSKGEAEPRDTKEKAARSLKIPDVSWDFCFLGAWHRISEAEVEQRGDSPVLVMHDGVTKSIFAHLIPAKGVDFPSCENVLKMIEKDLDTFWEPQSAVSCDNEPFHSCITQGGEVGLDW